MTKFLYLLVIAVLLLSGCGGNPSGKIGENPDGNPPITAPTGTNNIIFVVPKVLPPATVGVPYNFSFVTPASPKGGNPPYSFFLGSGVGFPPLGLVMDLDGMLSGTKYRTYPPR